MGKRKKSTDEVESEIVEAPKQEKKQSGKWIAKVNVHCAGGVYLKKGDEVPEELVEDLKSEGIAELA